MVAWLFYVFRSCPFGVLFWCFCLHSVIWICMLGLVIEEGNFGLGKMFFFFKSCLLALLIVVCLICMFEMKVIIFRSLWSFHLIGCLWSNWHCYMCLCVYVCLSLFDNNDTRLMFRKIFLIDLWFSICVPAYRARGSKYWTVYAHDSSLYCIGIRLLGFCEVVL